MSEQGKMRLTLVTLGVTLASVAVVGNAFYQKKQFYPSIVFLTKSNPSVAVLYAQAFVTVFLFGKAMRKIFFGQLRTAEVEHLIEKFWYVITETCLAFTVFRDDFGPRFVALFTFLLFMKAFHWLVEDRVDYMERSPLIGVIFHLRICSLLTILGTIDSILIHHAFKTTVASGASVQMVFGFEYAILLTMVVATLMKYSLHVVDNALEHPWENRNVYLLYGELITGFVKCCLYLAFVVVMVKIHTFPLFAVRPMYLTIRAFKKSLSDVILSRRAIAYMNTRFPDVTSEELERLDIATCIICRDRLVVGKKLPCNHIFHTHCLRSWFQRQQSCPTCRLDVLSARPPMQQQQPQQQQPQQQQHQQQQHQQQPQVPGFMNMPPFGMFPPPPQMPVPPAPQPQQQQQPNVQQSAAQSTTSPTTTTTTSATASTAPSASESHPPPSTGTPAVSLPPFTNPMFSIPVPPMHGNMFGGDNPMQSGMAGPFMSGMSGMPFPPPPVFPSMNLDMSALSVEQLKEMEGQERENIEARIRVLRNVHSLLDAVIVQLNQYSNVITTLNAMDNTVNPSNTSPESTPASENTTASATSTSEPKGSATSGDVENKPEDVPETIDFTDTSASSSTELCDSSIENELRRRRLQRFDSTSKKQSSETEVKTVNN